MQFPIPHKWQECGCSPLSSPERKHCTRRVSSWGCLYYLFTSYYLYACCLGPNGVPATPEGEGRGRRKGSRAGEKARGGLRRSSLQGSLGNGHSTSPVPALKPGMHFLRAYGALAFQDLLPGILPLYLFIPIPSLQEYPPQNILQGS